MEGNMSQGGNFPVGGPYSGLDLQRSMQIHHQAQPHHAFHHSRQSIVAQPSIPEGFPLTAGSFPTCDQTIVMGDLNKGERSRNSASDEDDRSLDGVDCSGDGNNKGKKGSPWQRVKWTDKMVRLLITAVSYIGEDAAPECGGSGGGGRRKFTVLQRKGKWKSVSKVLAERGFHVSPQQCEDKFNDLNKRYKKLNDMLGRGTSCSVVENPALLDMIDFLTDKEKDDVRKILSSKHLFYEEMCSYHNGNRLHLPHDPELQRSLHQALKSRDGHEHNDTRRHHDDSEDHDGDDLDVEHDDHDDYEEHNHGICAGPVKRTKLGHGHRHADDDISYTHLHPQALLQQQQQQQQQPDINMAAPGNSRAHSQQKPQMIEAHSVELEEQKLQIQIDMLELEKERFKWERFCRKKDRELEKMRLENEKMKIENERLALEIKHKEMTGDYD